MIFSIGHSTHTPEEFVPLVRGIDVVVDVRSHPTSRWDWWRYESAALWLPSQGFDYRWLKGLGGWDREHLPWRDAMAKRGVDLDAYVRGAFPKQRIGRQVERQPGQRCADLDPPQWTNQGLFDYSFYTTHPDFRDGLQTLIDCYHGPGKPNAVLVCAEALWWKCHRSLIADALVFAGADCLHLPPQLPKRETTPRWKRHSDVLDNGSNRLERYHPDIQRHWRAAFTSLCPAPA